MHLTRTRAVRTAGAFIVSLGLATIAVPAFAAPVTVPQDLGCTFESGDGFLVELPEEGSGPGLTTDGPIFGTSPGVDVTMDYLSPADPFQSLDVEIAFGAGIINATTEPFNDLNEVIYAVEALTGDGLSLGVGISESVALPSIDPVAPGAALPALPTGSVSLDLGSLAAGRTLYLQPYALVVDGDPIDFDEDLSPGTTYGVCSPGTEANEFAPTLDFPVTFTGDALPIPEPGDQVVTLDTDEPVSPGDVVSVEVSGFLPNVPIEVVECPVGEDCLTVFFEGFDPDELATAVVPAASRQLRLDRLAALATDRRDNGLPGGEPVFGFADKNGEAIVEIEIGDYADTACGPAASCEIVVTGLIPPFDYRGTAPVTYAADVLPTPPPATPPAEDPPAAPLPETGAPSPFIAAAGAALVALGAWLVIGGGTVRQRRTRSA